MKDIVERLRVYFCYPKEMCKEAADEIERLRREVAEAREIFKVTIDLDHDGPVFSRWMDWFRRTEPRPAAPVVEAQGEKK